MLLGSYQIPTAVKFQKTYRGIEVGEGKKEREITYDPIQVLVKGVTINSFLDKELLGKMLAEFPNIKISAILAYVPIDAEGKKNERITIGHRSKDEQASSVLVVDTDNPENLKKMLKVIEGIKEANP